MANNRKKRMGLGLASMQLFYLIPEPFTIIIIIIPFAFLTAYFNR